jgi:hypothetical protein
MIVPDLRKFLTSGSDKKTVLVVLAGPNGAGKTTPGQSVIPIVPGTPGISTSSIRNGWV